MKPILSPRAAVQQPDYDGYHSLQEESTGRIVVARLEIADTAWKRAVGLLGRRGIAEDVGLWIEPCNGIHTFAMRFALDVLFLDRDGRAIYLVSNLRPWRWAGPIRKARTVIELPAATIVRKKLQIGYRYAITAAGAPYPTETISNKDKS